MAEYILSHQAENDLLSIYKFTESKFGQYQADAYHAGFERTFDLLADFPAWVHLPMNWWSDFGVFVFSLIIFSTPRKPKKFLFVRLFTLK